MADSALPDVIWSIAIIFFFLGDAIWAWSVNAPSSVLESYAIGMVALGANITLRFKGWRKK